MSSFPGYCFHGFSRSAGPVTVDAANKAWGRIRFLKLVSFHPGSSNVMAMMMMMSCLHACSAGHHGFGHHPCQWPGRLACHLQFHPLDLQDLLQPQLSGVGHWFCLVVMTTAPWKCSHQCWIFRIQTHENVKKNAIYYDKTHTYTHMHAYIHTHTHKERENSRLCFVMIKCSF